MLTWIKSRYQQAGRYGIRSVIYTTIGLAGLMVEAYRFGMLRPFALLLWLIIFAAGCGLFLFMKDSRG